MGSLVRKMFFAGFLHKSITRLHTVTCSLEHARSREHFHPRTAVAGDVLPVHGRRRNVSWMNPAVVGGAQRPSHTWHVEAPVLSSADTVVEKRLQIRCEERFCFICTALTSSSAISLWFPHLSRPLISSTVSAVCCLSILTYHCTMLFFHSSHYALTPSPSCVPSLSSALPT